MSCAVIRMVCAERRTLPSRTAPTLSLWATVAMSGCSLNENEEVRAATCNPLISASELSSSSVSPSEKYSCSLSPLRFTNGSTAIECGGGLKAVPDGVKCFEIQKYPGPAKTTTTTIASSTGLDRQVARTGSLSPGAAPDTALNSDSSGDNRQIGRAHV